MATGNAETDSLRPTSLDEKSADQWRQLSGQVRCSRAEPGCTRTNMDLEAAAQREPESPAAPAYHLWMADNLMRDNQPADALSAYDATVKSAQSASRLIETIDPIIGALYHKAQAAALLGDATTAIAAYRDLHNYDSGNADPLFQAGLVYEKQGQLDRAADSYRRMARAEPSNRADDPAELARRALLRMEQPASHFAPSADAVSDRIATALEHRDVSALQQAASQTHFGIGCVGGHTIFEQMEMLDHLYRDLRASRVTVRYRLHGTGSKLYLFTRGWNGKWFAGDVAFIIGRAPRGWEWTGLAITQANDLWRERWRPAVLQKNQPLPFELLAPWPAGQSFKAGGLIQFAAEEAAVTAAGIFGGVLALNFSRSECGFGPRGFYFNQGGHTEDDAFAIDFTRYRQFVPYDPESGGTQVLAVRSGIVQTVRAGTPSGDSAASNTVEIVHADPSNPVDIARFRSRYLHLEGPFRIAVSPMMLVFAGNLLGRMDDTGDSVWDHLHFSIHDRDLPHPNVTYGASVRPTPMNGVRLEDGDSGTCVPSSNAGTGQLLSFGDNGTSGNVSNPVVVGFGGWLDFEFLFSGTNARGENRIYAVDQDGQLLSYGDAGTPGNVSNPVVVGLAGWSDFQFLFAGRNLRGENRIYAVGQNGRLLSYGDAGTPGNVSRPVAVGLAGWSGFKFLFSGANVGGENRIYAVDQNGKLLSYGDSGTRGNVSSPVVVGLGGWSAFRFLCAGRNARGENRIYAVDQNGQLLSYGDAGTPGNVSNPVIVGTGAWSEFSFVFAGRNVRGENRIYAVAA
jgi:hypothetical protein